MSELNERRWAVLSERGREEAGLSYEEAARLIARLRAERVRGLCVITDEAASRMPDVTKGAAAGSAKAVGSKAAAGSKPRRGRRKKDS